MSQQRELDVTKRDRFELLSAYLDGEASPEERRLVLTWLADDPNAQCLYRRLLHLRRGFQGIYQTAWQYDNRESTAVAVIGKLNYRFRLTCMAGLTAAAVAFIGIFSGVSNYSIERFVLLQPSAPSSDSDRDSLEIALDHPPITIPKSAVSTSNPTMEIPMEAALPQSRMSKTSESEL